MTDNPGKQLATGLGRAFGGALIFSLPVLMTMEMWDLGFAMERWRLVSLLLASLPLLMFLSHYSGFESTWGWKEDARDVAIACGIGLIVAGLVLALFAVVDLDTGPSDLAGKIAIQMIPAALGALLGRSQFGKEGKESDKDETLVGELGIMAVGALFLCLNVAPTEEMVLIAYMMSPWHSLALVPVTLLVMHGFVYATEFTDDGGLPRGTPWWSAFIRYSVTGYVVSLLVAAFLLWTFGQFDGMDWVQALRISVVLGMPAAIGAAAARLIL